MGSCSSVAWSSSPRNQPIRILHTADDFSAVLQSGQTGADGTRENDHQANSLSTSGPLSTSPPAGNPHEPTHEPSQERSDRSDLRQEEVERRSNAAVAGSRSKPDVEDLFKDIFLFKRLSDELMARVVESVDQQEFATGQAVVQQGEDATHFYIIQSGSIGVFRDGQHLRSLLRLDYFGERALLMGTKRSATCRAEEASKVLRLGKALFADIAFAFRKTLEHRMTLQDLTIERSDLYVKADVGHGAFGCVKLVHRKGDTASLFALKCVSKSLVIQHNMEKCISREREVMSQCYHPCIIHLIATYQDTDRVYFLMEFLGGGCLFDAMHEIGRLSRIQSQFFGGSIVLALQYLHGRLIMHRDLKPENIMLDHKGNVKLVDFGSSKRCLSTNSVVGTPHYHAPEVILGPDYTCAVDWWALGVIMYELVIGPHPFGLHEDPAELLKAVVQAKLSFPRGFSDVTAVALLSGLLVRSPASRLGASAKGARDIQEHQYFDGFNWDALAAQHMQPPWKPDELNAKRQWVPCSDAGYPAIAEEPSLLILSDDDPRMAWAKVF